MNPFTTPDRVFISRHPQDMRAGIQRLASIVTTVYLARPKSTFWHVDFRHFGIGNCKAMKPPLALT